MHPRTIATWDRLSGVEWFRNVGVRDTDKAEVLTSWASAVESCGSLEWENLCLEAVNQYAARLMERDIAAYQKWNDVVLMVRPACMALVREKTKVIVERHCLPEVFLSTVAWDILHLCVEAEYADVFSPGFFAAQSYWYAAGHFPCGWQGPFPNGGRLIIY